MKRLTCFLIVWMIWIALTWSLHAGELLVGAFFSLMISLFVSEMYPEHLEAILDPRRWLWTGFFLVYFLYYCLKANLDVAYRVLHPDTPIRPGFVKIRTTLQSDMAKTMLANSITLTPGTLTVDVDGQDLYIHWINVRGEGVEEHTRMIARPFEKILERIFQ